MEKITSEGKCPYCDTRPTQRGMGRHLTTHLKALSEAGGSKEYIHCYIKYDVMFLHFLVDAKTTLGEMDSFLRRIWLECCGHMSAFFRGNSYDEIEMDQKIGAVFSPKATLKYHYDFGSTTELKIQMQAKYSLDAKDKIILLSRNEPLKIMCANCETAPASAICAHCSYEMYAYFCDDCQPKHEKNCTYPGEGWLSVCNSPRMGVCAYDGGTIDSERDGIYAS